MNEMSEPSDFESVTSDVIISPGSFDGFDDFSATGTNYLKSTKSENNMNDNNFTYEPSLHDVSLTDSDHSLLEVPKLLNASSPSSICSTRPLEWDSGADVGYDITTSKLQNQDMSTIERIAVNSLVYNANSTSNGYNKENSLKTKSNSLINLNELELSKEKKSASFEALKCTSMKSGTFPKYRSPMASSLSVSTVIHNKSGSLNTEYIKQLNDQRGNLIYEEQEKRFKKLNISSNNEQKSSESSKESNSTLGSADTAGSWVAKEFRDSTNTNTDRVNSFEYLPGNTYYNERNDELEEYSDKEIKQSTKMLLEAMKKNGLTSESERKEIFKEIVESFLKTFAHNDNRSSVKSSTDSDQTPVRQDFTSQTSNTGNTIIKNQLNNQSSTITFTSPITSSRYGDDFDSKYDESSMDSGRHIDLKKCKSKKIYSLTNSRQRNQSVQCTIQDSSTNVSANEKSKKSSVTNSNVPKQNENNFESYPKKYIIPNETNDQDINKQLKKQMIWLQTNYMKAERENQLLWIQSQISRLNKLKRLLNTHEELKQKWNSYKEKQPTNYKAKLRGNKHPVSNSSSDFTTTKTDSTTSSKQFSISSRCDDTDVESSATVCDHVHYKKGMPVDEPKSMKKCCVKTLNTIDEKQKKSVNKFKTAWCQTEPITEIKCKSNRKGSSQRSSETYTVDRKLKPVSSNKSSISYDIIFKPSTRCSRETDVVDNTSKQRRSISVGCQTSDIPFKPKSSLQEYLMINRPDYVYRAEERQNILSDIASLRNKRKQLKKEILITNNYENKVPPNPLAVKRIMSQKEMRKQTERKYRKCPEVKNKNVETKRKEEYKTNKIMASIFNKRLQKKTLKGKVDLSNSVSVCSL